MTDADLREMAILTAARASYAYEGDRKGIDYIGWDNETDECRAQWIASVTVAVDAAVVAAAAVSTPTLLDRLERAEKALNYVAWSGNFQCFEDEGWDLVNDALTNDTSNDE